MAGFNRAELAATLSRFLPEETAESSGAPTAVVPTSTAAGAASRRPRSHRRSREGPPPAASGAAPDTREKEAEETEQPLAKKRRVPGPSSGSPAPTSVLPSLPPSSSSPSLSLATLPPSSSTAPALSLSAGGGPFVIPASRAFSTLRAALSPTPPASSTSVTVQPLPSASPSILVPPGGSSPSLPTGFLRPGTLTPGGSPFPLGLFAQPFSFPGDAGSPLPSTPWRPTEKPRSDVTHVARWSLKEADSVFGACAPSTHQALFHIPTGYDRLALANLSTRDLVRLSSQSCLQGASFEAECLRRLWELETSCAGIDGLRKEKEAAEADRDKALESEATAKAILETSRVEFEKLLAQAHEAEATAKAVQASSQADFEKNMAEAEAARRQGEEEKTVLTGRLAAVEKELAVTREELKATKEELFLRVYCREALNVALAKVSSLEFHVRYEKEIREDFQAMVQPLEDELEELKGSLDRVRKEAVVKYKASEEFALYYLGACRDAFSAALEEVHSRFPELDLDGLSYDKVIRDLAAAGPGSEAGPSADAATPVPPAAPETSTPEDPETSPLGPPPSSPPGDPPAPPPGSPPAPPPGSPPAPPPGSDL